ncbi:hypothetical protein AMTR_s00004p00224910 [Amborella trichopoda]|uniref:Myb/SANT-like domain-containing protein n=1 Tax=Amborella trichopoda TaxID=13333 RepID=W1NDK8_AMBTC|nr:hypothetical protein AMTR_s00004p00224910 [Amborella trichopoda]
MNVSGFGWDERRRIVTAQSAVWIDFLVENEWANKYQNKTLPEYSLLSKIYEGNTVDGTYKSIGGGITIEPERLETALSNDPPRRSPGNNNILVVDGPSKVRRDALKIVEDMWTVGEVDDNVFVMAARIFQDSTKAEMLLNLSDQRIQKT